MAVTPVFKRCRQEDQKSKAMLNRASWSMPIMPAIWRQGTRMDDFEFEARLAIFIERSKV